MRVVQSVLSATLSVGMVLTSTPGWGAAAAPEKTTAARSWGQQEIQGNERILHALNRFTFGPRPGDLEAVRSMGLDRWFEEQLHPASISDPELQEKLAQYPAMQWSSEDLAYRLPSNAVIRRVMAGKIAEPRAGLLHAVYSDQLERLEARRRAKGQPDRAPAMSGTPSVDSPAAVAGARSVDGQAGFDPLMVRAVLALPPRERVLKLAAMPQPELDGFFHSLKGPQRQALFAGVTPDYREDIGALENPGRVVVEELMAERLTRDIYAKAQLQEVMTDFWLNHFNIYLRKNETMPYYLASYARDVIRPHALGSFEDLLEAVAHSPAMLIYLDNAQSIGPDSRAAKGAARRQRRTGNRKAPEGINENYARELMELHTLGVNGGYTQADVIQAARVLTGWTVDRPQQGGGFQFNDNRHEPGTKKVLGKKFKEHGEREGEQLLHLLATRPATAQFLSHELAVRFVSDNASPALVNRMAKAYLSSHGNIAEVLRALYRSPEFWRQDVYRAKVKTPLEFVVSAVRASNTDVATMRPLVYTLRAMGMPLFGCIPPTGYKWKAEDWVSTDQLVDRMNFALALAANRVNGLRNQWRLGNDWTATPAAEEARLEYQLLGQPVSATTREAVLKQFNQQGNQGSGGAMGVALQPLRIPAATQLESESALLAGLLLGSPEFQRR